MSGTDIGIWDASRQPTCVVASRSMASSEFSPSFETRASPAPQDEAGASGEDAAMTELTSLTLAEARERCARRSSPRPSSPTRILPRSRKRARSTPIVLETPEQARAMAKASDARLARGEGGPLEGIPLGIKDLFCTEGVRTTAGSHILDGFKPTYELTVTANLWRDGAVMLGKLNMDEFAMGSSNETSYYGPVVTPWRRTRRRTRRWCRAARPAARRRRSRRGSALGATGTDTGGSIRQPAAFTGTVGIKPTYGRCSRWGIVAFASSLDQAGPIARTVRDCRDPAALDGGPRSEGHDLGRPCRCRTTRRRSARSVKGMKIGIPKEYRVDGMPDEIETLWQQGIAWLKEAGAEIVEISLPHTKYALPAYYIVAPAEASSNLARYDGVRYGLRVPGARHHRHVREDARRRLRPEVKRRIMIGTYVLSAGYYDAYYLRAQKVRTLIKRDFEDCFAQGVDAILTPATPSAAFGIGEKGAPIRSRCT